MLNFPPEYPADKQGVPTNADVPKDMNIYYRTEENFLPEGKTFNDLNDKEKQALKQRYRFDPLVPGLYQAITGVEGSI